MPCWYLSPIACHGSSELFDGQIQLASLVIDAQHPDLDPVADLMIILGMGNLFPGNLRNVHQAFNMAKRAAVHRDLHRDEEAKVHDAGNNTLIGGANLNNLERLLLMGNFVCLRNMAFRENQPVFRGPPQSPGRADPGPGAGGNCRPNLAKLAGGYKTAGAVDHHNQPALVDIDALGIENVFIFVGFLEVIPAGIGCGFLEGKQIWPELLSAAATTASISLTHLKLADILRAASNSYPPQYLRFWRRCQWSASCGLWP